MYIVAMAERRFGCRSSMLLDMSVLILLNRSDPKAVSLCILDAQSQEQYQLIIYLDAPVI